MGGFGRGGYGFILVLVAGGLAGTSLGQTNVTKGQTAFMNEGLQLYAFMFSGANGGFNPTYFSQSNFTGVMLGGEGSYQPAVYGSPGTFNWSINGPDTTINPSALPYFSTLSTWCYQDEQDLTDPTVVQQTASWMAAMRTDPRVPQNVLLWSNQWGKQFDDATLKNYMAAAQPDLLCYDYYTWGSGYAWNYSNGVNTSQYDCLYRYRALAMAGNDGTGRNPIPFGKWLQTFTTARPLSPGSQAYGFRMSDSQLRMDQFEGWAFGCKFALAFTYDSALSQDSSVGPFLFDGSGPNAKPTTEFYQEAEINRESRNLGPALTHLLTSDVRLIRGPNTWPSVTVPAFDGTSDPYMKGVSATNLTSANGGAPGDVLLGWYHPLATDGRSPQVDADTYFMVVNGLTAEGLSGTQTEQSIRLNFDFGDSGITSLERLSRDTGLVEEVPLISDGGSLYHLDLVLEGGTGDLFKYDDGLPFVGVNTPEPATLSLLMLGLCAATGRNRRRRR